MAKTSNLTFSKPKRKARKSTKPKMTLAKQIKQVVYRESETKMNSTSTSFQGFNSAISVTGDYQYIMPVLNVGTGPNNRIGDTIKPIRMVIEGYIAYRMDVSGGGVAPEQSRLIGARLFVFQDRSTRAYQNNTFNYNLLDYGGTSENYTGTVLNWIAPHNSTQFQFFADKKYKILKPYGYTNVDWDTPSVPVIQNMNTTLFHKFKIVIPASKMPSKIKYDTADSSNTPVNFCPMIACGYSDLLGYAADSVTTQIGMAYRSTLYYKDM